MTMEHAGHVTPNAAFNSMLLSHHSPSNPVGGISDQPTLPFPIHPETRSLNTLFSCICAYLGVECRHNLKAPSVALTTNEAYQQPNVIAHAEAESSSIVQPSRWRRQGCAMEPREAKGLAIAADSKITRHGDVWIVPSQNGTKKYTVSHNADGSSCTCPDFEAYRRACKHIYAVEDIIRLEAGEVLPVAPKIVRPTYKQQWSAYNLSQRLEKAYFQNLLFELCQGLDEPVRKGGRGRPPIKMADLIFAACVKIYEGVSGRRNQTDLREAHRRGFLTREVHYNTIFKYLEMESLTPYLHQLITETSLALKEVEVDFAVDSSGFSTCQYVRWFDVKHGGTEDWHDWVKLHLMTGVKTNIVTSCEVSRRYANDSPYFKPLLNTTAKNFKLREVSADKGYISANNLRLTLVQGAVPYIPFKENHTTNGKSTVWNRMLHFYRYQQEEFKAHYHKRSNVETTFWMIKSKFGERLRSKSEQAQINEALCKVVCHNICVVIQSIHELGLEVEFMGKNMNCPQIPANL